MIKLFFFALFISLNIFAEPCNVELYSKIYKFDKDQVLTKKELIKNSNCTEVINNEIVTMLNTNTEEIQISKLESSLDNANIHITPRKISIKELSLLLRDQLTINSNLYFLDNKSLNGTNSISLNENETLRANCESCISFGEKNIKLEISNPISSTTKTTWISTKIFAKIKVFKAKRSLSFQQKNLSESDFYQEEIYSIMPESILGSLEHIEFYKPNKTIMQGSIVKSIDIQPINLVNYGIPVKAILKSQSIGLTKMALPTRSAMYGEVVELKIGNNRSISGKVIDYNQVVIEL